MLHEATLNNTNKLFDNALLVINHYNLVLSLPEAKQRFLILWEKREGHLLERIWVLQVWKWRVKI
jgi:hypothetical protein